MEPYSPRLGSPTTGVVVTGAASGIGLACAKALAAVGRPVALWDIAGDAVREAAELVAKEFDVPTVGVTVDLGELDQLPAAIETTRGALPSIGALAHCAGVWMPETVAALEPDSWDRVLDVNLRAEAFLAQALLPDFRAAGEGCAIVGVSSIMAWLGHSPSVAYCSSKAGLLGLTQALAVGLGPDRVRVNAVCPGITRTPMIMPYLDQAPDRRAAAETRAALGRLCEVEDVARVVRFLLSDEAGFITGTHLMVDGGLTIQPP